jgi:hypothetical protein
VFKRAPDLRRQTEVYRTLLPLTFVLLTAAYSNAQTTTPTPQADEPRKGSISGKVVNENGQPLVGATIFVRVAAPTTVSRTLNSNIEGNFQATGLDPALYNVTANAPGYVTPPLDLENQLPTYRVGDSVRIELVRGGVITGTVTNSANEPVVGARVRTFMVRDATGKPTKGRVFSFGEKSTDDRGIYRIYGLAPGTYLVQSGGGSSFLIGNATDLDAPTFAPSSTRDTASEIQVRSGEETTVDIRFRGEPGHVVSGTVKLTGTTGASVSLALVGDGAMPTSNSYQQPGSRGFSMSGIADGDYELVAQEVITQPRNPYPDLAFSEPLRISVRGADVTGIELVPKPLASIAGKVVLEPSKLPDCQNKRQPLFAEMLVTLIQNRKENDVDQTAIVRLFSSTATLDRDGAFLLRNVRQGQYSFSTRFFARYWYLRSMSIGGTATTANPAAKAAPAISRDAARNWTNVKSGDRVSGLTVTLSEGAASLRGKIEKPEDLKLQSGLQVYLVPAEREKLEDSLRYFTAEVLSDGTFALNNLAPGRYWTIAQQPQANTPTTTEKLRLPDALEARTKLRRAAEAVKAEVELKPCQNVTEHSLKLN